MPQYKIPQNLDIEDKILGPFTLKQFLYMIVGGVTIYILFNIIGISNFPIFMVLSIPIALVTLTFVFARVNGRPFIEFIVYFLEFVKDPKLKRWEKSSRIKEFDFMVRMTEEETQRQKEYSRSAAKGEIKSRLTELAKILDTEGWSGELPGEVKVSRQEELAKMEREKEVVDIFSDLKEAMEGVQTGAREERKGLKINIEE